MIPTAAEFFMKFKHTHGPDNHYKALIEFAQMHVKAALEEAYENVFINDYDEHEQYSPHIDKDSITKAYPLTNIKQKL